MRFTSKFTINITNTVLGIALFMILATAIFNAQAHVENVGHVNDEIYSQTFHAVSVGGVAGSIVLHPGNEPLAVSDGKRLWIDNLGVAKLLEDNFNPNIKVSNPLGGGGGATTILPYDESGTYSIGEVLTVFGIPFVNKTAVTVAETFDPAKWVALERNLKTGVLSGGLISINVDPTKFDITALTGIIVDNSDTSNYLVTPISFPATVGIDITNVLTNPLTQLLVDITGTLIQSATRTIDDELSNLSIGRIIQEGGIAVQAIVETKTSYSIAKTTQALLASIGGQSIESATFSPGAVGLTLDSTAGKVLSQGRNFGVDSDNPDIGNVPAQSPIPAGLFFRTWTTVNGIVPNVETSFNSVDPNQYNPLGDTLVSVPTGKFQVQRIYTFGGPGIHTFYYGRTLYDTLEEAKQSFDSSDEFTEHSVTFPGAFTAHLIVQEGITDWSDPNTFTIINRAGGVGQSWDRGIPKGGIGGLSLAQKQSALASKSTGVFSGGGLSGTVGLTTFNINSGTGQVIDNSVPGSTTEDLYEWDGVDFTNVPLTELATAKHTYILLNKVGGVVSVVQIGDNSVLTEIDRKNKLYLGVIRHGTGTFVGSISQPQTIVAPSNKHIDGNIAAGKTRSASGNQIVATGAGLLTIDKEIGKSYGIGINAFNDGNNTDFKDNPAIVAAVMLKYSSVGHINGDTITNVDTSRFDPNGATIDAELVSLTGGTTHVAHRIWIECVTNTVIFQYGQASYPNEDDAIANFTQEDLSLPSGLGETSYLREIIVVQNGDANLDTAKFIPISGGGGSGGTVAPTPIVDNLLSTDPNSALSANQGRILSFDNFAESDLVFSGGRLHNLNSNFIQIYDGSIPELKLFLSEASTAIGTNGNFWGADVNGLSLTWGTGIGDLRLGSDPGILDEVFTSSGPNLPPAWGPIPAGGIYGGSGTIPLGTTSTPSDTWVLDGSALVTGDHVLDIRTPAAGGVLQVGEGTSANPLFYLQTVNGVATVNSRFNHPLGFNTNNIERGRFDTSGNFGIGTTTPNSALDITAGLPGVVGGFESGQLQITNSLTSAFADARITGHSLLNTNTQLWVLGSNDNLSDDIIFANRRNADMFFATNNLIRMLIDESGNIGIGTTTTGVKLRIKQANANSGMILEDIGGGTFHMYHTDSNSAALQKGSNTRQIELLNDGDVVFNTGRIKITGGNPGIGKVYTSLDANGLGAWETPSGGLASDSYLSINSDANTPFFINAVVLSNAGFGNNYQVLDLVQTNLDRTIDPSGMVDGANNTCVIQTTGTYEIFWSVSDDVGTQTYVHIRVNGTIISSGHSGSDTGASGMVTNTIVSLTAGDLIEFAFGNISAGTSDIKRPNIKINQIR